MKNQVNQKALKKRELKHHIFEFKHDCFKASFLHLKTESNHELKVSGSHLIAQNLGATFIRARELRTGDLLTTVDESSESIREERIDSIRVESVKSYSAPLTWHGTLLVNDVLTSSYAHVKSHRLAHFGMTPVRFWWYLFDKKSDWAIRKQANGTHWFPSLLERFADSYLFSAFSLLI